ncbi:aspartate kinase [Nocardia iowensis]|uniref:Aspartokinase n=1 Tax=Nocardia iowensis TaxID=204891 RepID=A0ABX8RIC0_NOCIO|nr:aspartate kinase [Nocardia iowensis]QXN89378.1 aspartate kinase [Nocardia iowensis]
MTLTGDGIGSDVLVQKYGGSSLATTDKVRSVADRIATAHRTGHRIVVVVSAQGETTDELQRLASELNPAPSGRELDQLLATGETASAALMAMALQGIGVPAVALSGMQSGMMATGKHGSGIIVAVDTERIVELAQAGTVVVVAGFQGVDAAGDVITLGRGGSDTTAVAIAAELRTSRCEIYTDVDGVYTADPRVLATATLMPTVDADVMMEMSFVGARVMHSRAVELAAMYGVDICVRNSSSAALGTLIQGRDGVGMFESKAAVLAVVHDVDVVRVVMRIAARAEGELTAAVFRVLARHAIPADVTVLSNDGGAGFSVGMTVRRSDANQVCTAITEIGVGLADRVEIDDSVGRLSIVGKGLLNRPEYAARMLTSLARVDIPAGSICTSQLRISVTVPVDTVVRAVAVLHNEFDLASGSSMVAPGYRS